MSDSSTQSSYRRPSLKYYRKKAEQLVKRHRIGDREALNLIKYNHGRFGKLGLAEIAVRKLNLRDAKTVIARVDGYLGWAQLKSHVAALHAGSGNRSLQFEQASDAVVNGRIGVLEKLLNEHPNLVRARSGRNHRATLLHYVAANGVEQSRQRTPANAVAVAQLLLERGAEPDVLAQTYGGGNSQTTLSLLVSSGWPYQAGLQGDLVRVLCQYGAQPDGLEQDGLPLATALVFFHGETARVLAKKCGARTDHLLAAASIGTPRDVDTCFTASGRLKRNNFVYIGFELRRPKNRLEMLGQAFVYAALCGNLATMKRLRSAYDCPVDAAADRGIRALHLAAYKGHAGVVNWLLQNGADALICDDQWHSTPVAWAYQTGQFDIRKRIIRSIDLDIHMAVGFSQLAEIKRMLSRNPELANSRNADGLLPIHCLHDDTPDGGAIIDVLIKAGANVNGLDPHKRTAIDRLMLQGRQDLVAQLHKLGGKSGSDLNE